MLEHFVELFLEILIPICELMGISIVAISPGLHRPGDDHFYEICVMLI